jgi:hypothetical protein
MSILNALKASVMCSSTTVMLLSASCRIDGDKPAGEVVHTALPMFAGLVAPDNDNRIPGNS